MATTAPALKAMQLSAWQQTDSDGLVTITVRAVGTGTCRLAVRAWNLQLADASRDVRLKADTAADVTFAGRVRRPDEPWVAVVVPDGDLTRLRDVVGATRAVNGR